MGAVQALIPVDMYEPVAINMEGKTRRTRKFSGKPLDLWFDGGCKGSKSSRVGNIGFVLAQNG